MNKRIITLLAFFICFIELYAQSTFTSPYTQHFPSGDIEAINRIITIYERKIIISTEIDNGKDIQTLNIINVSNENSFNSIKGQFYFCISLDGKFKSYVFIPEHDRIEYIEIIQPSSMVNQFDYYRLLIN